VGNISVTYHIRKVIFENFNDLDLKFNNDQIFEILKQNKNIDQSLMIDDMEIYFKELCDAELLRNIAQNFTTQWFKLFELFQKIECKSCKNENYLTSSEEMICQNQKCSATL
jgi:2C-methyl-D-erythritol 2,4-cyclodiphosphate synthase